MPHRSRFTFAFILAILLLLAPACTGLAPQGTPTPTPIGGRGVGDWVWFDENRNNIQDAGEVGVDGVLVQLIEISPTDRSYTVVASATTSGGGFYQLTVPKTGEYFIRWIIPASAVFRGFTRQDMQFTGGFATGGATITHANDSDAIYKANGDDGSLIGDSASFLYADVGVQDRLCDGCLDAGLVVRPDAITVTPAPVEETITETPTPITDILTVTALPTASDEVSLNFEAPTFCRSGPGPEYEEEWTFEANSSTGVVGTYENGWYLVAVDDERTRTQCCWVGAGILNGDPGQIPLISVMPAAGSCP